MLWGPCRGVSKLRGPEEGGPHVEGILRGSQNMCTGDRADSKEGFNHQCSIKIVMQVIKLKSCKILQG